MSLKFTKAEQGNILSNDGQTLIFEGIVAQVGVVDGIYISPEVLAKSARWLMGRPVTIGQIGAPVIGHDRTIGQVDEVKVWPTGQLYVQASLFPQKLSSKQLMVLGPGSTLQAHGGYFVMSTHEGGSWKGKNYQETANALKWDHLSLVIPEIKGHSVATRQNRLKEIEKSWNKSLGKRC